MSVRIIIGDVREKLAELPDASVHCCVTSPPYFGLRDYGVAGQIGLEASPDAYVVELVSVFREVRRVLRDDATLWLNLGDSYAANRGYQVSQTKHLVHDYGASNASRVPQGLKPKDLLGIPWRVAFALQADGWWLRSDIIWSKPNPMPESVTDRPTSSHEHIFLLAKSERYYFDAEAVRETAAVPIDEFVPATGKNMNNAAVTLRNDGGRHGGGQLGAPGWRNIRNVWTIATQPYSEAHFATFPPALIEPCIKAGCPEFTCAKCGTVLDSHIKDAIRSSTNGSQLRELRQAVPEAAVCDETQPLLQPAMYVGREDIGAHLSSVRMVRETSDTGSQGAGAEFLQQGVRVAPHGEDPEHNERPLLHIQGLYGDLQAGPSERVEGRLRDGAPACDGDDDRPAPAPDRDCASPEREQGRKRARKSRASDQDRSRQAAEEKTGQNPLPSLRGVDSSVPLCPGCRADMTASGAIVPGTVLDCFGGAGTTGLVADRLGRSAILTELNPEYAEIARKRISGDAGMFAKVDAA